MIDPTGADPHRFARPCPACGQPLPGEDAICTECGATPDEQDKAAVRNNLRGRDIRAASCCAMIVLAVVLATSMGMCTGSMLHSGINKPGWSWPIGAVSLTLLAYLIFRHGSIGRSRGR